MRLTSWRFATYDRKRDAAKIRVRARPEGDPEGSVVIETMEVEAPVVISVNRATLAVLDIEIRDVSKLISRQVLAQPARD
jgi:hypothetical protein